MGGERHIQRCDVHTAVKNERGWGMSRLFAALSRLSFMYGVFPSPRRYVTQLSYVSRMSVAPEPGA